jgi:hypothetical protein
MEIENIFERAAKQKLRFPCRGSISTEDLYDLRVEELDRLFKVLNAKVKIEAEESLLKPKEKTSTELDLQIAIVRHIVEGKLADAEEKKNLAAKRAQKQKLLEILSEKQDMDLRNKSVEELTKMLEAL